MPSIILTGHPCAGKSTLARRIRDRALSHPSGCVTKVTIINEQSACRDHSIAACYATSLTEKKTRGALKSAYDRAVAATSSASSTATSSRNSHLIVLDSSNYIKGFRYELHCISKAASCSHCVVWCLNDVAVAKEWNRQRRQQQDDNNDDDKEKNGGDSYSDELLDALILRYEPPDERNRWDKPLYKIDLRPIQQQQSGMDADLLAQSVYNMHSLSDTMGTGTDASTESKTSSTDPSSSSNNTPVPKKSAFKRAAFKRPNRDSTIQPMPRESNAVHTGPLTAEALASLGDADDSRSTGGVQSSPQQLTLNESATPAPEQKAPVVTIPRSVDDQIDDILNSFLLNVRPLQEGTSTRQHVATDTNVLHKIDSITQQLVARIVTAMDRNATGYGTLVVPLGGGCVGDATLPKQSTTTEATTTTTSLPLHCHRRLSAPELRRCRQQFLQWVLSHPPENSSEEGIARSFLAYIETQK